MRHRKKFNHLGRKAAHRNAMLANMASSLIVRKRITTTTAKAKALRTFVEPLITRSKEDSTHSRRVAFRHLRDKDAVSELFREVATKVGERPGGYTRIIKLDNRLGDNADMCIIELVDYNENLLAEKAAAKPKSTRRRRGGGKRKSAVSSEAAGEAPAEETAKTESGEEPSDQAAGTEVTSSAEETEEKTDPEAATDEKELPESKDAAPPSSSAEETEEKTDPPEAATDEKEQPETKDAAPPASDEDQKEA